MTYSPDGWECEHKVDETKAERGQKTLLDRVSSLSENSGGIESHDVDTRELLGSHDGESAHGGSAQTRDGEQLPGTCEKRATTKGFPFLEDLAVGIVHVASCNHFRVSKSLEGLVRGLVALLFEQPTRRFGTEPDEHQDWNRRSKSSSKLESPSKTTNAEEDEVGAEADENT